MKPHHVRAVFWAISLFLILGLVAAYVTWSRVAMDYVREAGQGGVFGVDRYSESGAAAVTYGLRPYRLPEAPAEPAERLAFITMSPVSLKEVESISPFRSCEGKRFGLTDINGSSEPKSSMRHIVRIKKQYAGNASVFAPYNGEIVRIDESSASFGPRFILERRPWNGWSATFENVILSAGLAEGSKVLAGEKIGKVTGDSFSVALQQFDNLAKLVYREAGPLLDVAHLNLDSIFPHMSESVRRAFSLAGYTEDEMVVSRQEREDEPCECEKNFGFGEECVLKGGS